MSEKSPTIVIGHKNPDTDSIVSVLAYSHLKTKLGENVTPARAGQLNNETKFVLSYLDVETPESVENLDKKQVILLDHGDTSQIPPALNDIEITEIIDHHKIGDIQTKSPILYRAEPVGSTSTVIAKIFKENAQEIEKQDAGLLLAGIISDTLFLNSPTATQQDKDILQELAKIAEIDPEELAEKMFEAKSDISGLSAKDIISGDYKEWEENGVKFGIGVFETVQPDKVRTIDSEIFKVLPEFKKEQGMDLIFFLIIDILKGESFMYLIDEKETKLAEQGFTGKIKDKVMFLPDIVSRKKQILPVVTHMLADAS